MESVINLPSGSVFKTDNGVFVKLMNPEIPKLAKVSNYSVWSMDTGNGHIEIIDPNEMVSFVGNCFSLLNIEE